MTGEFTDILINEIIVVQNDKKSQIKSSGYLNSGKLPIVDQSSNFICGYTNDLTKRYSKEIPVIVFGDHTLHLKYIDFEFATGADGTQILRPLNRDDSCKYLFYIILRETQIMESEGYKRHLKILKERFVPYSDNYVEQKKIASILTSVDEVIENTQKQIDKLQDLKKATMNELLTKGIGHTEFKDSELGRIPKSWEVKTLGELGSFKNGVNKPKEAFGKGTKFVNISDSYSTYLDCESLGRLQITDKEIESYSLKKGDLVFVRSSVKLEGVAYPTVFNEFTEPVVFCGFMIRYRPNLELVESHYLREYLITDEARIRIEQLATGGANININQESFSDLKVLLPSKREQSRIADFLSNTIQATEKTN